MNNSADDANEITVNFIINSAPASPSGRSHLSGRNYENLLQQNKELERTTGQLQNELKSLQHRNGQLAVQLATISIRAYEAENACGSARRMLAQLENQNSLLTAQLYDTLLLGQQEGGGTRDTNTQPPSLLPPRLSLAAAATQLPGDAAAADLPLQVAEHYDPDAQNDLPQSEDAVEQQQPDPPTVQPVEPKRMPLVPALQLQKLGGNVQKQQPAAAAQPRRTARGFPTASARRPTYGSAPMFNEIADAYKSVLNTQTAREDPVHRWVRTVMSSSSAIDSQPQRVEPVVEGLRQLCEEAGLPLPLKHVGACRYTLGAAKLAVRLVNGKLMARFGPTYVDIFQWLERQPISS